ncbi:organic cation transporter protein-like isoform X1 [Zootermopsis nevadensis]|uniref:organic cation transporter protein-like isoform X1 n=1 Tax=Zootermopsis nevadensis TaxID=136037 RepID=UPI000B8E50F2|nr:organic cation transporter protein-like isoform X1 [Zootermopsis nevadensis]
MDLDEILDEVGHFGKFQAVNYALVGFPILLSAAFALSYVFTAGDLEYRMSLPCRCRIPECDGEEDSFCPNWLQDAVPFEGPDSQSRPVRCLRYTPRNISTPFDEECSSDMFDRNNNVRCQEWVYNGEETTIVNEWNITCEENEWKLTLVGTVNNVGQFIGFPLAGFFSDRLLPESVRWLLAMGKIKEARNVIMKAAKRNGVVLSSGALNKFEMTSLSEGKSESPEAEIKSAKEVLKQVLHSKILLLRVVNCSFCWVAITFVFFGLSLTSVSVGGNKFTNFILVAIIELPAYIVFYFTMDRFGRKSTMSVSLILSGISCITFAFVPTDLEWVRMLLFLMGKFSITISFTVVYVYTTEMFPTELRNSLLGVCAMVGRIGSMIAPQTPLLERYLQSLPLLLFGGMSILSGLFSLSFPETLNSKLPDTVKDAENIGNKARRTR